MEYALGGDPTDETDRGMLPTFRPAPGGFEYVHARRTDDSALNYIVETTTNLVSGSWTNTGYTTSNASDDGDVLGFSTNTIQATEEQVFIRLRVE